MERDGAAGEVWAELDSQAGGGGGGGGPGSGAGPREELSDELRQQLARFSFKSYATARFRRLRTLFRMEGEA